MSNIINSYRFGGDAAFSFNNALVFAGADDYISYTLYTPASTSTPWTVSFWYYGSSTLNHGIFGDLTANDFIIVGQSAQTVIVRPGASGKSFSFTFTTSTWYHFMVTRDSSGNIRAYMNGVESSTGLLNDTSIFSFSVLGRYKSGNYFNGKLDEVGIWDNILGTLTNAQDLYNSGSGADAASIIASPYLHYHLDESGTDTTAIDSSGNGNDGTLTNFPASGMWVTH